MDKSRVCVNQAAKMAKQKCVKKTNLLVYEKKYDPCTIAARNEGYVMPPMPNVTGKRIRICTGADLRKMCPPKLCDCPPKKSRGFFGTIFALLGLGVKAAVAAGLVYWTYDMGFWGDSEETEDIYLDVCEIIFPACADKKRNRAMSPLCEAETDLMCKPPESRDERGVCLKAPSPENAAYTIKSCWNKAVVTVFDVLTHFPTYVGKAYTYVTTLHGDTKDKCGNPTKK